MGKEFELKYKASPEVLDTLEARFGGFHTITMETTYFDTPDRALGRRRWTLRRRYENGVSVCGLKTPGRNEVRGEWEVREENMDRGLEALCAMDVPEEFPGLIKAGLVQVCGARFDRRACLVTNGSTTVEIALDQGVFLGGSREKAFSELEIELKSGSRQETEAFGQALAREYGLETETVSKFERALALAREV